MNESGERVPGVGRSGRSSVFRAWLWRGALVAALGLGLLTVGLGAPHAVKAAPPYASCAAARADLPSATDGHYLIVVGGRTLALYCHDMAGMPREYLSLLNTGGNSNFAQYTAGEFVSGTNVRTNYTKLRFDPATLQVNIIDQTFSSSTGQLIHGGMAVTTMPFGVAMTCADDPNGRANIDLTGTGLQVNDTYVVGGFEGEGTPTGVVTGQVVSVTGGGACGWNAPEQLFNPFNQDVSKNGGFVLQLAVVQETLPPVVSLTFPSPGAAGWFNTPTVTGTVSAIDSADVTALQCIGGGVSVGPLQAGTATTASAMVTVMGDGIHDITCTATNGAGTTGAGAGSTNTATVRIDSLAPQILYLLDPQTRGVQVRGVDQSNGAGLATTGVIAPSTCTTQRTGQTCVYRASDNAGNSTTMTLQITKSSTQTRVRVTSFQYSGRPAQAPLSNETVYDYNAGSGPLTFLKQCGNATSPAGAAPSTTTQVCMTWSGGDTTIQVIRPPLPVQLVTGMWALGIAISQGGVLEVVQVPPLP